MIKSPPVKNQRFNLWLLLVRFVFGCRAMKALWEEPYDCHSPDTRIPIKVDKQSSNDLHQKSKDISHWIYSFAFPKLLWSFNAKENCHVSIHRQN